MAKTLPIGAVITDEPRRTAGLALRQGNDLHEKYELHAALKTEMTSTDVLCEAIALELND